MTGTVRTLYENKGFGFIKAQNGDHFFHQTDFNGHWDDLVSDYNAGRMVEVDFKSETNPKGLRARNVSRTDWPNQAVKESNG